VKPQNEMCKDAFKAISETNDLFLEIMKSHTPLTKTEIQKLIHKRPELWGRFRSWAV